MSPQFIFKHHFEFFSFFSFELIHIFLLLIFKNRDEVNSIYLEMSLQIISQCNHKKLHSLEVFSWHFTCLGLLKNSLKILLQLSRKKCFNLIKSVREFIYQIFIKDFILSFYNLLILRIHTIKVSVFKILLLIIKHCFLYYSFYVSQRAKKLHIYDRKQ
jgi:hypothetical protein